jgi:hypothetical protein
VFRRSGDGLARNPQMNNPTAGGGLFICYSKL